MGETYKAQVSYGREPMKIHICHVLPSHYTDVTLIIYKVYGKHKQWWHEFMCTENDMDWYIELGEIMKSKIPKK